MTIESEIPIIYLSIGEVYIQGLIGGLTLLIFFYIIRAFASLRRKIFGFNLRNTSEKIKYLENKFSHLVGTKDGLNAIGDDLYVKNIEVISPMNFKKTWKIYKTIKAELVEVEDISCIYSINDDELELEMKK